MKENLEFSGRVIFPLSGSDKPISWEKYDSKWCVYWGKTTFYLPHDYADDILNNYFKDFETWYPLGASMDDPIIGGLGEYIQKKFPPLTPRHASAIASILVNDNLIDFKGKKPIMLIKVKRDI